MATYTAMGRTSYFKVKDENAYQELIKGIPEYIDLSKDEEHAFGYDGMFTWIDEDGEANIDWFLSQIQELLEDNSVFIAFEIGNEKFRYVTAIGVVVTPKKIKWFDLDEVCTNYAKSRTGLHQIQTIG